MSYNNKLLQTGRKVANARRKYYGSFDYGSGIDAKLRGGTFSFGKKYAWGGPDGKTWIPEIDETEVDEPDVQAMIAKYFRKHPNDAWKFGKNPETGLDYDTEFEDSDFSGKGGGWWQLAGIGLDATSNFMDMNEKRKAIQKKYDAFGTTTFNGLTDNNALLSTMANTPVLGPASTKDFRDKSVGQDIFSVLDTGVTTTMNSGGNYWLGLAAMGAKTAQVLGERWNAGRLAKEASAEAKRKNLQFFKDMHVASQDVDARNDWTRMLGYYNDPVLSAFGGPLHSNGGDYNGGLTYIDEGGRHEENPYEGVPSGFDEEGNPNLVEEGEVIWNNEYVFSDRLKVPKELANKYKLGGKKDYTFAEAIEKLTKENKVSPNDFITIATTKEIVNEFMDAQEAIREQEQLAAREELEAAQAQDFLAQLDAVQGGGYPMGAPIDMGNAGMGMPNEAPVTEGQMMPPGYAFGGNKFVGGGDKDGLIQIGTDANGNTVYILPNGTTVSSYREAQARIANMSAEELNFALDKTIPYVSAAPSGEAGESYVTDIKPRPQQPQRAATDKDFEITEVLTNSYTTGLQRRKGYKVGNQVYLSRKDAEKAADELKLEYATTLRDIPGYGKAYRLSDGTVVATKEEARKKQKEHNRSLRTSSQQNVTAGNANSSANRNIGTTAMAAEMPTNFNAQLDAALGVQDTLNIPAAQQPVVPQQVQEAQVEMQSPTKVSSATSGAKTGRMTTPSGNTINYRRDINGKEWESAEPYQNFLSYMRGKGADDKEVKEWMDYIQSEIKNSGSKYKLKNFDDWSHLAEDGKVGPVHQATLKAAEYFARRQGLTAVNPDGGPNPTIAEVLGVKPESLTGVPQNSVSGSTQASSGNGTAQEPQFSYRDTRLRYAPPIGAAMDWLYRRLNRPDYSNADRIIEAAYRMGTPINIPVETIGDYRRRNPFDERYLVNMANQNRAAAARGIANTAGGNRSMDLLGNMSLAHSNQQELGEIMRQAYLANRQDDAQVAEFNRGTNVYNMNAINQRNLSQAQLNTHRQQAGLSGLTQGYGLRQSIKDNWDDAAMESYNSLLASLGAIGKENEEYNILTSMAEQGYFPWYYGDRSILQYVPQKTSNGGKLNRKKRRF